MSKALIVVDMQNDFISGALAVPGAPDIVDKIINKVSEFYQNGGFVFYSKDWHPFNHSSFLRNGGVWPIHCVQETWGAELPKRLQSTLAEVKARQILKGIWPEHEQYSAFTDEMKQIFNALNVNSVEVCGLARDYCVKHTVMDLKKYGYYVKVLEDLCRSVSS